jgi:hypothetical protein
VIDSLPIEKNLSGGTAVVEREVTILASGTPCTVVPSPANAAAKPPESVPAATASIPTSEIDATLFEGGVSSIIIAEAIAL